MFSKACEHGIKAIIYIATQSLEGRRVKIGDVAENAGSPEAFTAKVLGALNKHDIVNSHTGPYGGFEINIGNMKTTKLSDIVYAIDGNDIYMGCALGLANCSTTHPCPLHDKFAGIRSNLKHMLENTSIYDLAVDFKNGKTTLVR